MTATPVRLAFLVTHPIQYATPLFRRIAQEPGIELTVLYQTDLSAGEFHDPGFGRKIAWDVPLLDGYRSEFLPALGPADRIGLWHPFPRGLARHLTRRRFDWVLIHGYSRPAHILAMLVARIGGVRVLIRDEATPISKKRGPLNRVLKRLFFAGIGGLIDGVMAIGRLNGEYYRLNGFTPDRIFHMPYAVDNDFFRRDIGGAGAGLRRRLGIPAEAPVILYASKLQGRKHADHLVEAFTRLRQRSLAVPPHLVIVGDGELLPTVQTMAAGADDIHLEGFKGQQELIAYYDMCDVFVLPSSGEPWGLVVNEAMNRAKAIIVSDQVGSGPDLVRTGENGFIFPVGDIAALTDALEQTCCDRGNAQTMGRRSLEMISRWDFEADIRGLRLALGIDV
jgi:glycosyltransferase involved in cell wall biosynthesis